MEAVNQLIFRDAVLRRADLQSCGVNHALGAVKSEPAVYDGILFPVSAESGSFALTVDRVDP